MKIEQFHPTHYIRGEDGEYFLVMFAYSQKQGEKAAFTVAVDQDTGRVLGSVVESRIRVGFNDALYFSRNKRKYYLSWLKRLPKRVDKK